MAIEFYGSSITFQSGWFAEILSVNPNGMSRKAIETSHAATVTRKTYAASKLIDWGMLKVEIAFNPSIKPPLENAAETVTITWPVPDGLTTGATWAGTGFLTEFDATGQLENRMTANATIKFSGNITVTAAS